MSRFDRGARPKISTKDPAFVYDDDETQAAFTAAKKARREIEFGIYLGQIGMEKDDFLENLRKHRCKLEDFYTYLDALTLADENPDEPLEDLIQDFNNKMDMDGGGMRQVGGSLGALLALHIKIFKSPYFAKLTVGASLLLLQNTIELLNSLDECFVHYGRWLLTKIFDWMMGLCKYLYDNRDSIGRSVASGAKTVASAAGTAAVATPGAILYILRGVDALAMKFAEEYNPELNGFNEILDAVKRRNEEHHARMEQLAAEQAEAAKKATDKTMALQAENFVLEQEVASMDAIQAAKNAAGVVHAQLTEHGDRLKHRLVMGEVREGKSKGKGKGKGNTALKAHSGVVLSKSTRPRLKLPGIEGPRAVKKRGDSESDDDFGGGGKRATRKRGKRSSKRGSRKTKTTRKKTTRKKIRGKK